jgi:hypothetical protein
MSNRSRAGILISTGLICLLAMAVHAADINFAGNWKGETKATPPPAAGAPGEGAPPSRGGGRAGGFGGGGGGTTKVSLNLKQSKENKLSGNITIGDGGNADDVKEGKVEGDRITFSAGRAPQPIYAFVGEMKGDELLLTRIAPAGDRGPRTTEYVLKKKK